MTEVLPEVLPDTPADTSQHLYLTSKPGIPIFSPNLKHHNHNLSRNLESSEDADTECQEIYMGEEFPKAGPQQTIPTIP